MNGLQIPMLTYVLELEEGKWYVGKTLSFNVRLGNHINGTGSKWTTLYPPKRIDQIVVGDRERELTLKYMTIYKVENVRGANWCQVKLTHPPKCFH